MVYDTQHQTCHDPSVSPDGKRVAFLEYTDGTVNLATINIDGSDKNILQNIVMELG